MIRRMLLKDFLAVKNLFFELQNMHCINRPDIFKNCDLFNMEYMHELINTDDYKSFVEEIDNNIIGFVVLKIINTTNPILQERKIGFIEDIYVAEKFRNKGYGKNLLNYAKEICIENNCNSMEFKVWSFNEAAINFYNNLGFENQSYIMEQKL